MSDTQPATGPAAPCRRLLFKSQFIHAEVSPEDAARSQGSNFWCALTQTIYGPDQSLCDADRCRDATRTCYEPP